MTELKSELGTIFGYDKASRDVGITGEIELVEIDGPTISVSLKGRFWHATDTVMMRVVLLLLLLFIDYFCHCFIVNFYKRFYCNKYSISK